MKMKNIFKISKRGIIAIFTLCILFCTVGNGVHAAIEEDTTAVAAVETTQELMPMMARGCGAVPQSAYSMYSYITSGYDTSIYTYHEYENTSYPRLPGGTTYVTYYMPGLARLVIGANGSAYYTPNHYKSWIKMY